MITRIGDTASSASDSASAATDAAKKALETLSGISTLDAIGASLNNDAHVVHTYADGTGGDYSSCYTVFSVYLGDTDVSDHIDEIKATTSPGIAGTWDPNLRKYQVIAMSTDSGYVDISALYGLEGKVLLVGGKGLVISGKTMVVKSMGSWITKRFSVSKAKDGKIGLSYDLRASTQIIKKLKDDKTLEPANVTFSAFKNDNGMVSSYSGKFQIEESTDSGKTYNIKYGSTSPELMKVYTPSGPDVNIIKCSLYDESGVQLLDTQTVSIISDAAGLAKDIAVADKKAQEANTLKSVDSKITLDAKNGKITTAQDNSGRVTTITPGNVSTGHIAAVVGHIGTSRTTVSYIKIVEEFSAGESKDHSSMCINGSFMADGESIKIYNAKHVTSGGHLVFDSDGSTVAYLSSSAKRYKNHLSNMTLDEAEKILDIPVVWFNYKEGYLAEDDQMNGKPVPGMYAEDVAKYYPVGAYNNEEGLVENWNERMIIPAMLKLLQNLYKRIS